MDATSTVDRISVSEPLLKTHCMLGEGPLYESSTSTLHFVDIANRQVFHYNTITRSLDVDQYDEPISCLALRRNGRGLACAAAEGFALIDPDTRRLSYICKVLPEGSIGHVRFNDGACDSEGRFFAGTISSTEPRIPGQLYRFDPKTHSATLMGDGFTDCNGLGWSADEKTMYFTDSLANLIYAYDYDKGEISNRRIFADCLALGLPERTYPDGLCIDSEGGVWSARWGGSKIVRHTRDGTVNFEIVFPTVLNVTACCFGGPNDDQLYVTTAHCSVLGGDPSLQKEYHCSGDLFVVDLADRFKGGKWRHYSTL